MIAESTYLFLYVSTVTECMLLHWYGGFIYILGMYI